jgi:hypothetical protein
MKWFYRFRRFDKESNFEIRIPACRCPICIVLRILPAIVKYEFPDISGRKAMGGQVEVRNSPALGWQESEIQMSKYSKLKRI